MNLRKSIIAICFALAATPAAAQLYLPQGVSVPAQSVIGNAKNMAGDAVAVPFSQLKAVLGVPQAQSCAGSSWVNSISSIGVFGCGQPHFSDLFGSINPSQLPAPTDSSLGGIESNTCSSGNFLNSINTDGSSSCASSVTGLSTSGLATGGPITTTGTVTVTAASKADEQTGTSSTVATTPSQQQSHPSAVKAWVSFAGSTATISGSYNVSSVTRSSAGVYTINFTAGTFSNTHYACTAAAASGTSSSGIANPNYASSPTTSSMSLGVFNFSGTPTDYAFTNLMCTGTN